MITLITISLIYALIRSKHDSFLREGKWKRWGFIEGVFIALVVSYFTHESWYVIGLGALVFGMVFWIAFDILMGLHFGKHPLYIGNTGTDKKIRGVFAYSEKWKGLNYLIFKLVWTLIILGLYKNFAL